MGLNPCSNGTYSRSIVDYDYWSGCPVLILVLMEHTLGDFDPKINKVVGIIES